MGVEAGDDYDPAAVVVCKGKRSKRQRVHAAPPPPPPDVVIAASVEAESSSSSVADQDDGWLSTGVDQEAASGCVTEEEEDMALCLMLLARGGRAGSSSSSTLLAVAPDAADSTATAAKEGKFRSRRPADGAGAEAGEFVYECKTCGRCFPSFQALGGHRTSHKKPRPLLPSTPQLTTTVTATTTNEKKRPRPTAAEVKTPSPAANATAGPMVPGIPATPPKHEPAVITATGVTSGASRQQHGSRVHECSMCGAEFASGQALGGHMRRHRPLLPASSLCAAAKEDDEVGATAVSTKEKSFLELDLNMPAPCDDASVDTTSTVSFTSATVVDCHY
ncbi:zinc finger protein ZAT5-like [Lolium rigidum]|uniref:zinc finger protein ZAT5-like n=1 Tax=Lolium rigidum TaxID=89674 RepID=UPI001F5E18BA|nr:zinc finger protein ZAT5-like [Lolium rigidum]